MHLITLIQKENINMFTDEFIKSATTADLKNILIVVNKRIEMGTTSDLSINCAIKIQIEDELKRRTTK